MKTPLRVQAWNKVFVFLLQAALVLAFFLGASYLFYRPALDGPLVLDDGPAIADNPAMHIVRADGAELWRAARSGPNPARLLPNVSFALGYLRDGLSPGAFRTVNALLHGLCAAALFLLIVLTARTPAFRERGFPNTLAFLAACLWFANPVQAQAVSYIVQRMTVMASLFYILSLSCYAAGRLAQSRAGRTAGFSLCALLGACALVSKENAVLLVFFLPAFEVFFFREPGLAFLRRRWKIAALLVAAGALAGLAYTGFDPLSYLAGPYKVREFTMGERLLTQPRVIFFYLSLFFWPLPSRLALDHGFTLSRGLFSPPDTFFAIAALAAFLLFALAGARRHRALSFLILWYFGNLVIESSVLGLEMVFEHRAYLPSMAAAVFLVLAADRLTGGRKGIAVPALLVICALFSWATVVRNKTWGDELRFYRHEVAASPEKARPHYLLSSALLRYGKKQEALAEARMAADLAPASSDAFFHLGRVLASPGIDMPAEAIAAYYQSVKNGPGDTRALDDLMVLLAREKRFSEAREVRESTLMIAPENPQVRVAAGMTLLYEGKHREAIEELSQAIRLDPSFMQAHYQMGLALARAGMPREAEPELSLALTADPLDPTLAFNAAMVEKDLGRYREAISKLSGLLLLTPKDFASRFLLAELYYDCGDHENALAELDRLAQDDPQGKLGQASRSRAERIRSQDRSMEEAEKVLAGRIAEDPGDAGLLLRQGLVRKNLGRLSEAEESFQKALVIIPEAPDAWINLALVAMAREDYEKSEKLLVQALALSPDNQAALYNMACLNARQYKLPQAQAWAERLLKAGYSDFMRLSRDRDLANLRKTEWYQKNIAPKLPPVDPAPENSEP
ncbi:MAG: tetratricopeptide repeat protein [Thermodesulfobacteriota bacterium]